MKKKQSKRAAAAAVAPFTLTALEQEPPVDFLVKNILESDQGFLEQELLVDYSYTDLVEFETGLPPDLRRKLLYSFEGFYGAHGKADDFLLWLLRRDMNNTQLNQHHCPAVSSYVLTSLCRESYLEKRHGGEKYGDRMVSDVMRLMEELPEDSASLEEELLSVRVSRTYHHEYICTVHLVHLCRHISVSIAYWAPLTA